MDRSPPIVCFVGRSGSGKTTLLVEVIRELGARGYRVASVKHDVHGATLDTEGKDSWRHKEAGAETVVLVAPGRLVSVSDCASEPSLPAIGSRFAADADILIVEGFKRAPEPKIEVARAGLARELLLGAEDGLIAVATDFAVEAGVPRLDLNAPEAVADFIESRFLPLRGARA
ncbi:MAG: molybdopterin-guanine dinucleotide biosynthesis protein B [Deltaproteobacteria bacterium]|nr:molybdopterin-guanine dinucleotide biosynthesis protein B [Deltaproteobacteria bacterium]